ncbi:MAG: hypothetical protein ACRDTG_00255 [Pseudonocardiaceae bacterium]
MATPGSPVTARGPGDLTVPTTGGANEYGSEELSRKRHRGLFRAIINDTAIIGDTALVDDIGPRGETRAAQRPKAPTLATPDLAADTTCG